MRTGKTSYANPRLGEILGMPPSRLIGLPLSDFLVDDDASWSGSETKPDPFAWHEIRLRGGDGVVRHAIVTSQAVGPDEVPGDAPCVSRRRDRRASAHGDRRHAAQASRGSASGKGIGAPKLLRLVGDGHGRRRADRRTTPTLCRPMHSQTRFSASRPASWKGSRPGSSRPRPRC